MYPQCVAHPSFCFRGVAELSAAALQNLGLQHTTPGTPEYLPEKLCVISSSLSTVPVDDLQLGIVHARRNFTSGGGGGGGGEGDPRVCVNQRF